MKKISLSILVSIISFFAVSGYAKKDDYLTKTFFMVGFEWKRAIKSKKPYKRWSGFTLSDIKWLFKVAGTSYIRANRYINAWKRGSRANSIPMQYGIKKIMGVNYGALLMIYESDIWRKYYPSHR